MKILTIQHSANRYQLVVMSLSHNKLKEDVVIATERSYSKIEHWLDYITLEDREFLFVDNLVPGRLTDETRAKIAAARLTQGIK